MYKRWLLGRDETRVRDSFLWNTVSGLLNALQSAFILFLLQRAADESVSGAFSIAFATANLMLAIGKYGMRYFQAADLDHKYTYGEYFTSRILTSGVMLVAAALFAVISFASGEYTEEKAVFCFFLCLQKVIDSVEDVLYGEYQRMNRLDTASRLFSVRLSATVAAFLLGFLWTRSLLASTLLSAGVGAAVLLCSVRLLRDALPLSYSFEWTKKTRRLLLVCFPLFTSGFTSLFLVDGPKYAIDFILSDSEQALYGFISFPVFAVALLAECLFRPMTTAFAEDFLGGKRRSFTKRLLAISLVILGLTVCFVGGGALLGTQLLGWFFHADLSALRLSLSLLLLGGGAVALSSFFSMLLTVMQHAGAVGFAYLIAAACSLPVSITLVKREGLFGAALSYLLLVSLLCLMIFAAMLYFLLTQKNQPKEETNGTSP